jgi:4-alpha-glucanotransferase
MNAATNQLHRLAGLYGINTSYQDMNGRTKPASVESILAVLKALGSPLSGLDEVSGAIRDKRMKEWQRPLEPVTVLHDGESLKLKLNLPKSLLDARICASMVTENGEPIKLDFLCDDSRIINSACVEGDNYVTILLCSPDRLPIGYHKVYLELPGKLSETLVISAPLRAYNPPSIKDKIWGAFLPLYALHTRKSWGAGDFSDLERLMECVYKMGGNMIGTLPLLPSFFDEDLGPSPYMPASRLFWNEFYLDVFRIPELEQCTAAQAMLNSANFENELKGLRRSRLVVYTHQLSLKRKILEALSDYFFTEKPIRFADFETRMDSDSSLEDYARFRAAGEKHGIHWHTWQQTMRDGDLKEGDYLERNKQYHLYTQWLAGEQIQSLSKKAASDNLYLYLDLPVGVHPCSYDVWKNRDSFVTGVSAGAPPDPVFTGGQNWSFPPLNPEKIRQHGYRYVIDSLRHQLKLARMLRVDHMMHFHRLFWIPEGMENREGLYVNYRFEELYAILALESYRHQSVIVGEDLGIVPAEIRPTMKKHGIFRTFVEQYQLSTANLSESVPSDCIASLNTHDMFPFAAFWQDQDISDRIKLNLLTEKNAKIEVVERREAKKALLSVLRREGLLNQSPKDSGTVLKALLNLMASSPAYALLINLEDLWQEVRPQNIPGTLIKQNWSRKARYGFERFSQLPQVNNILYDVNRLRKEG